MRLHHLPLLFLASLSAQAQDVFDVHMHALPPQALAKANESNFGPHRRTYHTMAANPAELLAKTIAEMDKNSVRKGLLTGAPPMVAAWVKAYPDRFLPSFVPDFAAADHAAAAKTFLREVEEKKWFAMGELGLAYQGWPLNDARMFPYYEACERKGLPVFFHTGLDGPDPQQLVSPKYRVELADPLLLQDVVIRFPKLKIVIMHMGWPYADHALYMLYAHSTVYMDVAVTNWVLGPVLFHRLLREAVDTVGSDRILFGSDQMVWPQMITKAVEAIRHADYLTDADKRNILWNNAASIVPWQ